MILHTDVLWGYFLRHRENPSNINVNICEIIWQYLQPLAKEKENVIGRTDRASSPSRSTTI